MNFNEAAKIMYGDDQEAALQSDRLALQKLLMEDLFSIWKFETKEWDEKCNRIAAALGLSSEWKAMIDRANSAMER